MSIPCPCRICNPTPDKKTLRIPRHWIVIGVAILIAVLFFGRAHAAVTLTSAQIGGSYSSVSSADLSFVTLGGSNQIIVLSLFTYVPGSADVMTGATYNGHTGTRVTDTNNPPTDNLRIYTYYIPVGSDNLTANIHMTFSTSVALVEAQAVLFDGASQSVPTVFGSGVHSGGGSLSFALTSGADGSYHLAYLRDDASGLADGTNAVRITGGTASESFFRSDSNYIANGVTDTMVPGVSCCNVHSWINLMVEPAGPAGPPAPTIAVVVPENGTLAGDFTYWGVSMTNLATGTDYTAKINYTGVASGTDPFGAFLFSDEMAFRSPNTTGTQNLYLPKSRTLSFPITNSFWVATGTLIRATSTDATSSEISFGIFSQYAVSASGTIGGPTGTSTLVATCDPASGLVANSLCRVGLFLFYPSPDIFTSFSELGTLVATKPPLGYFFAIKDAISIFNEGTSSIVVVSTSTESAFADAFVPIKTGLAWLLWLLFTFWAIVRLKHFDP